MMGLDEQQILAWLTPVLWPFLRVLALFQVMPVLGQRIVPTRVRVALSLLIGMAASTAVPLPLHEGRPIPLDAALAVPLVLQQLLVGWTLGFAVRIVFAAVEFAGEVAGLQMGLNFAGFFDPLLASQATATSRYFGNLVSFLFIAVGGHLTVLAAVVQSLQAVPVAPDPLGFILQLQPWVWGAEVFRLGLWIALPLIGLMLMVNLMLGIVSRVAPQANIFSLGFPVTLSVGLLGMVAMLPSLQTPFLAALERLLSPFQ
ncbi:flagellar biosynthetic protein FliR [Ideonella livida]|uniref:Flagellar biosynthetic protein FliR n=1 Tax=Ideonella livida TaxID=2707176 RepID=A0A7C9PJ50_9BURK|nr:flagellar biosynthetic protein FliR [Ideonella livida]NDY92432.1 flagellar biosynthetic protein FliR [Ideonella livida]